MSNTVYNFLLSTNKIHPGAYVMLGMVAVVAAILIAVVASKKIKIAKLNAEYPQAVVDYLKIRVHICPLCDEKYSIERNTVEVMDRPSRLISGTFFSAEYSSRYNAMLTCPKCGYRIKITHHRSLSRDEGCNEVAHDSYTWSLHDRATLSAEDQKRINDVLEYKSKIEDLEPEEWRRV